MGLRARLALFFIAITVIPLTVAVIVLQVQLGNRIAEVTERQLESSAAAVAVAVSGARDRAADMAIEVANGGAATAFVADDAQAAQQLANRAFGAVDGRAGFLVLVDDDGTVLASRDTPPQFRTGVGLPGPTEDDYAAAVAEGEPLPGALVEIREVRGDPDGSGERRLGWVGTGIWADESMLQRLPTLGAAAIVAGDQVLAATGEARALPISDLPASGDTGRLHVAGEPMIATVTGLGEAAESPPLLVLWQATRPALQVGGPILALLVPAVLLAAAVGWVLASSVVAPVERAARVAENIAAGDLDQTLEPSGGRELAGLAGALNLMSSELRERLEELEASRDQLRQSLSRLGQTLSSSLDLDRTLAVVVETGIETLGADRGMLWLFTPERDALYVKVGRGVGQSVARLPTGSGIAGHVGRVGVALRMPADRENVPFPSEDEPSSPHQLAVPMVGRGRVLGVLTILRDDPDDVFTQDDLDTLRSFAAQASVAMENVMLHQEAQRLSVTDPLTGLWNFRYFQLQADRELESAARFHRSLSMLIIDLDHFKAVNDRFGHQVGDDVLLEVARRIQAATRVPDVVARYGGEEFVVLLPGTDLDGAMATAERIRTAVASSKIAITTAQDIAPMSVTCSIGVAEHPRHGTTVAGLLRSADAAMYQAKSQGRDRVVGAGRGAAVPTGRIAGSSSNRR
jgi:diguanylate cyclase (GGDEF)-like protein